MKSILAKLDSSQAPISEQALVRSRTALSLKDKGDYDGAREAMRPFWKDFGQRPEIAGLAPTIAAEVLLCVGILTRWIGSKNQVSGAQDVARDLISESITFYESLSDARMVAVARAEIGYCYWRAGALEEARIMFSEALQRLTIEGNARANVLLGLSIVEWSASRYEKALDILTQNESLFRKIKNHTLKGTYHNQVAMVLRKLATAENRTGQFLKIIKQYEEADNHFRTSAQRGLSRGCEK